MITSTEIISYCNLSKRTWVANSTVASNALRPRHTICWTIGYRDFPNKQSNHWAHSSRPDVSRSFAYIRVVGSVPLMAFATVRVMFIVLKGRINMMQTTISHMPSITSMLTTEALLVLHASEWWFEFKQWSLG